MAGDLEIIDDWYTVGLKGTGSKTVVVNDIFIPEYRTIPNGLVEEGNAPGRQINAHPMYGAISSANFTAAIAFSDRSIAKRASPTCCG